MVKQDYPLLDDVSNRAIEDIPKDRRTLVGFDLGDTALERVRTARLRLNLVPSGLGFSSLLPAESTFEVYGIADRSETESWPAQGLRWEDAPGSTELGLAIDPGEASLLGSFTVPRGRESGSIFFESEELAAFLRADTTGQAGFLIVTTSVPVDDWGRVHAFAASTHPLAAGPVLELDLAPEGR